MRKIKERWQERSSTGSGTPDIQNNKVPDHKHSDMVYWLPNTGASSARLYWESFAKSFVNQENLVQLPTGCSIFPREIVATPRSWAEQRYKNIQYWNELEKGGHFAAFEQPDLFVTELRKCFSAIG